MCYRSILTYPMGESEYFVCTRLFFSSYNKNKIKIKYQEDYTSFSFRIRRSSRQLIRNEIANVIKIVFLYCRSMEVI